MNDIKPMYSSAPVLLLKQPQTLVFGLCFDVADIALGLIVVERNTELF